ncbi:SDR family oxidoreductase|uniref:NAD(P)-dependent dehydrogenase, short-chain alcohol dehydrogenase family n=1 Tax=Dendrosporobacter quercicolus TaxID=146817 RepID=A0A1G9W729_9FIRM|nr:SDR family NAD(P)-dependent oxidoreductase [Dendrosporobacter quercicolus]NSL47700.1 SDR family oxidoreductase [Dendrosporobacter quercicolus DSM 1736]SDM80280.1 NAD(P)-dependent dehydrogenase, short-chain alcohol dehydrogenase family [Dendrosporobacter quercicolus]
MIYDFSNKAVLITGGTSGIGLATAKTLLAGGAKVAIAGSSRAKGQTALAELADWAGSVKFIQGNVAQVSECQSIVKGAAGYLGKIDIVINSAGIYLEKPIDEVTEEEYQLVIDVNLKGTYFIAKYAIPELKKTGNGAIVNVSSDAGINGNLLCTAYCAAKGAVTTFSKALALELAPHQIRVNCVCPGDIDTPMLKTQLAAAADPVKQLWEMAGIYPIGRIGRAAEVAAAICFLASDQASLITGVALPVDGGLTAC